MHRFRIVEHENRVVARGGEYDLFSAKSHFGKPLVHETLYLIL
jgi:hypothetical protein